MTSSLVRPFVNSIGTNTQMVVSVDEMIGADISFAPSIAALTAPTPSERILYMFSITTMELSTSIPTLRPSPEREMTFRVMSLKYISSRANITLSGIERATMRVGLILLRKSARTIIASRAPQSRLLRTSLTMKLIYIPWSIRGVNLRPLLLFSSSSSASLTVFETVLVPFVLVLNTPMMAALFPLSLAYVSPSLLTILTEATSLTLTSPMPSRWTMTIFLISSTSSVSSSILSRYFVSLSSTYPAGMEKFCAEISAESVSIESSLSALAVPRTFSLFASNSALLLASSALLDASWLSACAI